MSPFAWTYTYNGYDNDEFMIHSKNSTKMSSIYPQIFYPMWIFFQRWILLHNALSGNFNMKDVVTDIIGWL